MKRLEISGVWYDIHVIRRLKVKVRKAQILCGPAGVPVAGRGAWNPGWFTGYTTLALGRPSPFHL
jgi:hypothetical protein